MKTFVANRVVSAILTLFVVSSFTFVLFQVVSPVDPLTIYMGKSIGIQNPLMREMLIARFGLNESVYVRYVKFLENTFTLNFGVSIRTQQPVSHELAKRIGPTLLLGGLALGITALVGIPVGILAATRRGSKVDVLAIGAGLLTWGLPSFFIQLLFLLIFSLVLRWFPAGGMVEAPPPPFLSLDYVAQLSHHIALPLTTIVLLGFGSFALYTRNMMVDTLTQDFIVTARAKGLKNRTVVYKHALRATLPPVLSMFVLYIPTMFWLVMMAEIVFQWPGIGFWFLQATLQSNYPVVQAIIFLFSLLILVGNFVTDLVYAWADPRIRVGSKK